MLLSNKTAGDFLQQDINYKRLLQNKTKNM